MPVPTVHAILFLLPNKTIRPTGRESALELDGAPDVAGVAFAAGLFDVGSDRVQLTTQFLDVLRRQMGVFLDVTDGHVVS